MADPALVKRNIKKMLDQGASEAEVDQYVSEEGMTPEQLRAAPVSQRGSWVDPVMQGLVPFADEIGGAVGGAISTIEGKGFKAGYDKTRDSLNADYEGFKGRNPKTAVALEVAGSIPSAFIPLGAAAKGANLASKAVRGGLVAGAQGGMYGLGAGEGGADRIAKGVTGAAIGGSLGAVAPAVGRVVAPLVASVKDATKGLVRGAGARSMKTLDSAVEASGRSAHDLESDLLRNPRLTLADVDPNFQQQLMGVATQQGPGRKIAIDAINARKVSAPDEVSSAFDAALGGTPDVRALVEGLKATAKANAERGFGEALAGARPVDVSDVLRTIDAKLTPGVQALATPGSAIPMGPAEQAMARVKSMLTNGRETLTDANRLHVIQSQLRREAETLSNSSNGQDRLVAHAIREVRQKIVDAIDPATGGKFKPAQRQFADDMAVQDAFDKGLDIFRNRSGSTGLEDRPEYLAEWLRGASVPEREALKQGIRVAADQAIGSVSYAARRGAKIPEVALNREKLALVLGPDEADKLSHRLGDEMRIADTNQKVADNSMTQPRQEGAKATKVREVSGLGMDMMLPAGALLASRPGMAAGLGLLTVGRRGVQALGRRSDMARNAKLATGLTATGPERAALIQALIDAEQRRLQSSVGDEALARALVGVPGQAATPAATRRLPY